MCKKTIEWLSYREQLIKKHLWNIPSSVKALFLFIMYEPWMPFCFFLCCSWYLSTRRPLYWLPMYKTKRRAESPVELHDGCSIRGELAGNPAAHLSFSLFPHKDNLPVIITNNSHLPGEITDYSYGNHIPWPPTAKLITHSHSCFLTLHTGVWICLSINEFAMTSG